MAFAFHARWKRRRLEPLGAPAPETRRPALFHKNGVFPMEVTGRETISLLSRNSTTNLWHRKDIYEEVTFNEVKCKQVEDTARQKLLEEEKRLAKEKRHQQEEHLQQEHPQQEEEPQKQEHLQQIQLQQTT